MGVIMLQVRGKRRSYDEVLITQWQTLVYDSYIHRSIFTSQSVQNMFRLKYVAF